MDKLSHQEARVLDYLQVNPTITTAGAEKVSGSINYKQSANLLLRMEKAKLLKKVSRGIYTIGIKRVGTQKEMKFKVKLGVDGKLKKENRFVLSLKNLKTLSELEKYAENTANTFIYNSEELGIEDAVMLRDENKGVDYFFNVNGSKIEFEEEQYPDKDEKITKEESFNFVIENDWKPHKITLSDKFTIALVDAVKGLGKGQSIQLSVAGLKKQLNTSNISSMLPAIRGRIKKHISPNYFGNYRFFAERDSSKNIFAIRIMYFYGA